MKSTIAFIPLRSGSKGIEGKNIKDFNGRPLCYWSIKAASESSQIDEIYISSDSQKILDLVGDLKLNKVNTFLRSKETSSDEATTESAMVEIINKLNFNHESTFVLIQATSPFVTNLDLDAAISKLQKGKSIISVSPFKRFIWNENGPVNYDYFHRKRRQEFNDYFIENGSFYINYVGEILKYESRLSGKIEFQVMSEEASLEIDTEFDWDVAEYIHGKMNKNFNRIKLFLTDLDGVLTDGGVYCNMESEFLKKFNVKDGMGFELLRKNNILTGIVTTEKTSFSDVRAKKIQSDFLIKGESFNGKLESVLRICEEKQIDLSEVAYIGDDINCFQLLSKVGYPGCPNDAVRQIKNITNIYISPKNGGDGCVRDFIDKLLSEL